MTIYSADKVLLPTDMTMYKTSGMTSGMTFLSLALIVFMVSSYYRYNVLSAVLHILYVTITLLTFL